MVKSVEIDLDIKDEDYRCQRHLSNGSKLGSILVLILISTNILKIKN